MNALNHWKVTCQVHGQRQSVIRYYSSPLIDLEKVIMQIYLQDFSVRIVDHAELCLREDIEGPILKLD